MLIRDDASDIVRDLLYQPVSLVKRGILAELTPNTTQSGTEAEMAASGAACSPESGPHGGAVAVNSRSISASLFPYWELC